MRELSRITSLWLPDAQHIVGAAQANCRTPITQRHARQIRCQFAAHVQVLNGRCPILCALDATQLGTVGGGE